MLYSIVFITSYNLIRWNQIPKPLKGAKADKGFDAGKESTAGIGFTDKRFTASSGFAVPVPPVRPLLTPPASPITLFKLPIAAPFKSPLKGGERLPLPLLLPAKIFKIATKGFCIKSKIDKIKFSF